MSKLNESGAELLRLTLLQDAIDRYVKAMYYLESHESGVGSAIRRQRYSKAERTVDDCESFFLSTWFETLYDIDPVLLIMKLRELDHSKKIVWQKGPYTHRDESELWINL